MAQHHTRLNEMWDHHDAAVDLVETLNTRIGALEEIELDLVAVRTTTRLVLRHMIEIGDALAPAPVPEDAPLEEEPLEEPDEEPLDEPEEEPEEAVSDVDSE